MPTFRLIQRACDFDLPPEKTVTAACIHTDDDFVRFHDTDHGLVYAVQRGLLLAIETVANQDSSVGDTLNSPSPTVTVAVDGNDLYEAGRRRGLSAGVTTPNRWLLMRQFGWSLEQANELPDWLVSWLHDQH